MFMLVLAIISLLVVCLWNPVFEHMTNAAVQAKHEFHAKKPTSWDMNPPIPTKKKSENPEHQIYGPKVTPLDPNEPAPTIPGTSGSDANAGKSVYPDIYGPEEVKPPGNKDDKVDSTLPLPYDYVPAAEFPAGPLDPSPFLTDFSKILKT